MQKSFKASQYIFQQGEDAGEVLRVVEGTVELVRKVGRAQVLIDTIEPGGFVGTVGPVLGQPRGATAQAVSEVTVETLSREEFIHQIRNDPDAAETLLARAGARLRGADDPLLESIRAEIDGFVLSPSLKVDAAGEPAAAAATVLEDAPPAASSAALPALEIKAASDALIAIIGDDPIPITRLPFMVGRTADPHEQELIVEPDLPLQERAPHRFSRRHFLIYAQDGGVYLRDLESTLGTTVNGKPIGRKFRSNVAELKPGENRVTAGDAESTHAFVVSVG